MQFSASSLPADACSDLASNQAQPLLIWWRRDLGLGASKNRPICNHYVFKVVSQNLAYWQRVTRVVTRVSGGTAERRTGSGTSARVRNVARLVHGRGDALLRVEVVTRVDVLRLERFVNPQKNVGVCWVCSSSLWTSSLFDPETRAAEERRSCLGWKSCYCRAADWIREVAHLSVASFRLWPSDWSSASADRFNSQKIERLPARDWDLPAAEKMAMCGIW